MNTEIELKLRIAPEQLARLRRHKLLRSPNRRAVSRKFYSEYYDTLKFELRREGVGLRLRREGARTVQTVKLEGKVEGGLHQRPEWEIEARDGKLDFAALAQAGWNKVFNDPALEGRLRPIFVTAFKRSIRIIEPKPGSVIECCIDEGQIEANGAAQPICELELELKSGAPADLFEFALALDNNIGLALEPQSKAERGYALLDSAPRKPVKAESIKLSAGMTVAAAFRKIGFSCIEHLQSNEAGTLVGDNPEYLHQMRVAARRLRSGFSVFASAFANSGPEQQTGEIQWLGRILGDARDWDVFETETLAAIATKFPDHEGLSWLKESAAAMRGDAGKTAHDALTSRRYQQFLLRLSAWLTTTSSPAATAAEPTPHPPLLIDFAGAVLDKRYKQVRKRGRKLADLNADERHQLRIAVKKLRYASEFFLSLYPKSAVKKFTAALADLQQVMGGLNDAAVTRTLLARLDADDAHPQASGIIAGYTAAQSQAALAVLEKRWGEFERAKKFW